MVMETTIHVTTKRKDLGYGEQAKEAYRKVSQRYHENLNLPSRLRSQKMYEKKRKTENISRKK